MYLLNKFGPHKRLFMAKIWYSQLEKMESQLKEMESQLANP
jgi:hypothetical protein